MPENSTRKIIQLSESVVRKIAAGEVVERPVSVIKELVENSLDAGATQVHLQIKKGGMDSMIITDNGCGIPAAQLELALQRHATSKIQQAEDLFELSTLGFRGEALPAIASVSRFRIESATTKSDPIGYVLEVQDGKVSSLKETPLTQGTRIIVEDLFCTTPARLKFLKRPETEWSHIADLMTSLALSRLDVEWKVEHNGKKFLFCPPTEDPRQRVLDLFGKDAMEQLYPFEREVSEMGLWGLVGHPNFSKRTNRYMFVYVNGRYVQDRVLNHAIVQGYRSLLMTQQYPMVVLHLQVPPALVDVNVHPSKREVKFSNSQSIHHLVSETIRQALETAPWKHPSDSSPEEAPTFSSPIPISKSAAPSEDFQNYPTSLPRPPSPLQNSDVSREGIQQALSDYAQRNLVMEEPLQNNAGAEARIGNFDFGELQILGQFKGTYLICESQGSLLLIDQHAAHERIGFENLKQSVAKQGLAQQQLLEPITLEFPAHEAERFRPHLNAFAEFGLQVEEFGERAFVLKAYPSLLEGCDWKNLLSEVVEKLESSSNTTGLEGHLDHILATMACHRQIRAHHHLEREEMDALLQQLQGTPRSYHCPHGRPVMVEITSAQIEKWFKRVL